MGNPALILMLCDGWGVGWLYLYERVTVTFPGGFTDGGKSAMQSDLKTRFCLV